jgi:crossover junction endodeoxyribonuclease RuvC
LRPAEVEASGFNDRPHGCHAEVAGLFASAVFAYCSGMAANVRIIGIDPGLRRCGWGVLESSGNRLSYVACGVVKPPETGALADRLAALFDGLNTLLDLYRPDEAAVEETFVNAGPRSALQLGQARGVALMTPAARGIPVGEYAANLVKKSVVGTGHADKAQVQMMVKALLPTADFKGADAADALAIAICHAHHRTHQLLQASA